MISGSSTWDLRGLAMPESGIGDKERAAQDRTIPNGSTFYEIDGEHRVFRWDSENEIWVEQQRGEQMDVILMPAWNALLGASLDKTKIGNPPLLTFQFSNLHLILEYAKTTDAAGEV